MDQDQFRSLLATSTSKPTSASTSKFGKPPPKPTNCGKTTDFKPRPPSKKSNPLKGGKKATGSGDGYRDRAAERRAGKESDFAGAEKLLQEFEARKAAEREREQDSMIKEEEERKYLGGDAEHSILVKGLDMALLERRKLELSATQEKELEDVEDELDRQLEKPTKKGKGKEKEGTKGKTRDELLEELKKSRSSASGSGGFKPIGEGEGLGKGWKKLGAPTTTTTEGGGGGGEKKLRKKKKKVPVESSAPTAAASSQPPVASTSSVSVPVAPLPLPTDETTEGGGFGSDDDIFGDAGSYKGFDSDSDSDADADAPSSKPAKPLTTMATKVKTEDEPSSTTTLGAKRKYFDDDDDKEEGDSQPITTAPSAVTDLASRQASHVASTSAQTSRDRGLGSDDDEEDDEMDTSTVKLQPLSGGRGPSVRELLEMDKAAEEEEKRQSKKLKRQQKALEDGADGKGKKDLSEADKANRDYLQMEAYLAKKKNGSKTPAEEE
ncbi:uncharacterized protein JCM6883_001617 [Sporobolomyces salmoneus]|uniref:uncharacterized protein n=1 Tax=Sporobolomyces salmoneus TaxID=183962 RepID=UPI0031813E9D